MNKELIKLDNNTGIVSNELGTLNIVKTNNQKFSIEQILKTENDLDLIMNQSVIPLLYEYYFDKTSKVKALVENSINGTDFEIDGSATGRIRIKKK